MLLCAPAVLKACRPVVSQAGSLPTGCTPLLWYRGEVVAMTREYTPSRSRQRACVYYSVALTATLALLRSDMLLQRPTTSCIGSARVVLRVCPAQVTTHTFSAPLSCDPSLAVSLCTDGLFDNVASAPSWMVRSSTASCTRPKVGHCWHTFAMCWTTNCDSDRLWNTLLLTAKVTCLGIMPGGQLLSTDSVGAAVVWDLDIVERPSIRRQPVKVFHLLPALSDFFLLTAQVCLCMCCCYWWWQLTALYHNLPHPALDLAGPLHPLSSPSSLRSHF